MSRVVLQDPKSIKQLEKELYKAHKESTVKIKKTIEDNKNIKIDIKTLDFKEYEQFKESFTKIKEKINFIDELINDLKKQSNNQSEKLPQPSTPRKETQFQRGRVERTAQKFEKSIKIVKTNHDSVIKKHIDYLEYLKKILETKVTKDVKIMNLFNAVMNNTNGIIDAINSIKKIKDDKEKEKELKIKEEEEIKRKKKKQNKKNRMKNEILKCNKDLKKELNTISGLSNVKYDKDILKKIDKSILSSKIDECNKKIAENLQNLINTVKLIQDSKFRGGVKFPLNITNTEFINKLSEITKNEENAKKNYTKDLKKIKDAYEKGLKENIEDFKAICKALTEYLKKLQEITKSFLKIFFERSNLFIKEKKEIYEDAKKKITDKLIEYLNQKKEKNSSAVKNVELKIKKLSQRKKNINAYRDDSLIIIKELSNTIETLQENKEISENKLNEINLEKLFLEMKNNNSKNNIETLELNINDLNERNEKLNQDYNELEKKETKLQNLISYFQNMGIKLSKERDKLIKILDERGDSIETTFPALRRRASNTDLIQSIKIQDLLSNTSKNRSKNNSNITRNSEIIERINYFDFYLRITSMHGSKVIEQLEDVVNKINENIEEIEENIEVIKKFKKEIETIKEQKELKKQKQENLNDQISEEKYRYDDIIHDLENFNNELKQEKDNYKKKKDKMISIKNEINTKITQLQTEALLLLEDQDNEQAKLNEKIAEITSEIITNLDDYLNKSKNINNLNIPKKINNLNNVINVIDEDLSKTINDTRSSLLKLYQEYQIIDGNEKVPYYEFDEEKNEMLE